MDSDRNQISGCPGQVFACGRGVMNGEWNGGTFWVKEMFYSFIWVTDTHICIHKKVIGCTFEMCTFPLCKLYLNANAVKK